MKTFDIIQLNLNVLKELGLTLNQWGILYQIKHKVKCEWLTKNEHEDKEKLIALGYIYNGKLNQNIDRMLFDQTNEDFEEVYKRYPITVVGVDGKKRTLRGTKSNSLIEWEKATANGLYAKELLKELDTYLTDLAKTNSTQYTKSLINWLKSIDLKELAKEKINQAEKLTLTEEIL